MAAVLLKIPFLGIINGLLVPILLVPPYLFDMPEQETLVYQFLLYGILAVLSALFCLKGKNWRSWFRKNMQRRSLRRSAAYVEHIAKELKRRGAYRDILTDRYLNDMVVAAPLHDIGKIHIPDAVLNKPGRLTEEYFSHFQSLPQDVRMQQPFFLFAAFLPIT